MNPVGQAINGARYSIEDPGLLARYQTSVLGKR